MKRLIIVALCLFSVASLSALAQREQAPTDKVVITWWHPNSGLAGKATDTLIDRFNETVGARQGILVQGVYQGKANDVLTKSKAIMQSSSTRDLPDLVQLDGAAVLDVRDDKSVIYMEELAKADGYDLSQVLDAARLSVTYRDTMIAMPFNASTILLYYNKSAFDEVGITAPPKTLDEVAQAAAKLKQTDAR